MRTACLRNLASAASVGLGLFLSGLSNVGANSNHPYQVGPTGFVAEDTGGNSVTVTSVRGGPANGLIEVGDRIYGVNGNSLSNSYFTNLGQGRHWDPRVYLGDAITSSEAGDGQITFDLERGGSRIDVTLQLGITNIAYSATWPDNCPKSDLIIQRTATKYVNDINSWMTWETGGHRASFVTLFLLSTGEPEHVDAVRTLMGSLNIEEPRSGSTYTRNNWYGSLKAIAVAEYYIRTGDATVLTNLQNYVNDAFATESVGGWGHGFGNNNTGFVKQNYVESGLVNAVGGQVFTGVALARECGVAMTDEAFEKSLRYYYQTAGVGAPIYGDHRYNQGEAVNGKLSLVGAGISMLNEPYASASKMIAAMDGYNVGGFEGGHSGNYGNVLWRSITSGLNEHEGSYRHMMDRMRWYLELCRDYDGTFTLLPAFDSTRYDDDSWGAMVGLNYTAIRSQLRMTGAPATAHSVIRPVGEVMPKSHEYFLTTHAEGYTDADYGANMSDWLVNSTFEDIRKNMRHWHPRVRYGASMAIGHLATDANLDPVNSDGDPDNDLTDPAVDLVIEAMQSDDARVRSAGLKGITGMEGYHTSKFSDFEYDSDDYRRMAPYVAAILADPDSDHWELDAATWAMYKMPTDVIRNNIGLLLPLLDYEYTWLVRLGAWGSLSRLPGPDLAPIYDQVLDCFLREVHNPPRIWMHGSISSDIDAIRPHLSNPELLALLESLGDDLAGGTYPRDKGYQASGGHIYDAQAFEPIIESFTLDELATISDDINSSLSRYTNPLVQGELGNQSYLLLLYQWIFNSSVDRLWQKDLDEIAPFFPAFKAFQVGGWSSQFNWEDRGGEVEEVVDDFILPQLAAYESVNGLVELYRGYDFTADPPTIIGPNRLAYPDNNHQAVHYKLEVGSGSQVQNHGMLGRSADGAITDVAGWSNQGIAPHSHFSLDANQAWITSDNSSSGRIQDSGYIASAWIRLNDTLPDEDAHFVVFSSLDDFDFGVRRLDVGGEWKNTLFFDSAHWGNPIYAMNDSSGRPDIFLETGMNYFIMFERRRSNADQETTLLHLYEPTQNVWMTSDGNHSIGNSNIDSANLSVGIGSIDSDVLDPATRFPGLIDSVQMWSNSNTRPRTQAAKLTLARQNALYQITEQPGVLQEVANIDGTSVLIHNHLVKAGPAGSTLTVYFGDEDGGMNPANWDQSHTFPTSESLDPIEHLVEGLIPNKTYYARAHVLNPVGAMLEYWTPQPIVMTTLSTVADFEAPVADAGINTIAIDDDRSGTATVTLDGSASTDNIAIQTYTWTDQSNNVLSTGSDAIQNVELASGFYVLTLTTADFNGNSSQSTFEVDVYDGNDATAPNANAGRFQELVDYDGDGFVMVELDGSGSGSNGISPSGYRWEVAGSLVATGENTYATLPVGRHFVVMTVEGAGGVYNQDSVEIEIITADDAIRNWAEIDTLDHHVLIAAQDFTGMGQGLSQGSGEIHYTESSAPNREIPFWGFTLENETNLAGIKTGITALNETPGQESYITDGRGRSSGSQWSYFSDPVDVSAYANCKIAAKVLVKTGKYSRSNYLRARVHMELDDGTLETESLFFKTDSVFSNTGYLIASYDIPNNAKYAWIEVSGRIFRQWMGVDNVILVGQVADPPSVSSQAPDRIEATSARLRGRVIDNGRENPRIRIYYGTEDRGETTAGWDGFADLGTRSTGNNFFTTVNGLSELTTYYYRVHAENSAGATFAPTLQTFRTGSTIPIDPATFSVLPIANHTTTTATLNGQIDDTGGDAPYVRVFFGLNDRGNTTDGWDQTFDLGYVDGSFTIPIADLAPYRGYSYRIYAQNHGGNVWSGPHLFATQNPGDSVYISIQSNVNMSAASWDRGAIPGAGDIAIIDDPLRFDFNSGWRFEADTTMLSRQIRIQDSIIFKDVALLDGSDLNLWTSHDTVRFGTIDVQESGRITYRSGRSNLHLVADAITGDGELTWDKNGGGLSQLDCADMSGFTGLLKLGGISSSTTSLDLVQDIAPEDASFAMQIISNRFVLSGSIAVTDLTVDLDPFTPGVYTLDTSANPGAIDLSNFNGRDYSPFFEDLGGTITVSGTLPVIEPPQITASAASDIILSSAEVSGEVISDGGQSPSIALFYGLSDQGASTSGWDAQVDLGVSSGSFSTVIGSLTDGTEYFYRFYAQNSAGGVFSPAMNFTTPSSLAAPDFSTWLSHRLTQARLVEYNANPNSDFDGDGLTLVKEYFFGRDPLQADSRAIVESRLKPNEDLIQFSYERRKSHGGVTPSYEFSTDLSKWDPLVIYTESKRDTSEGMEEVTVEIPTSLESGFFRILLRNTTN